MKMAVLLLTVLLRMYGMTSNASTRGSIPIELCKGGLCLTHFLRLNQSGNSEYFTRFIYSRRYVSNFRTCRTTFPMLPRSRPAHSSRCTSLEPPVHRTFVGSPHEDEIPSMNESDDLPLPCVVHPHPLFFCLLEIAERVVSYLTESFNCLPLDSNYSIGSRNKSNISLHVI